VDGQVSVPASFVASNSSILTGMFGFRLCSRQRRGGDDDDDDDDECGEEAFEGISNLHQIAERINEHITVFSSRSALLSLMLRTAIDVPNQEFEAMCQSIAARDIERILVSGGYTPPSHLSTYASSLSPLVSSEGGVSASVHVDALKLLARNQRIFRKLASAAWKHQIEGANIQASDEPGIQPERIVRYVSMQSDLSANIALDSVGAHGMVVTFHIVLDKPNAKAKVQIFSDAACTN